MVYVTLSILSFDSSADLISLQLLDVLNAHFQTVFGITKLQSTLLQVAYFGAYLVWAPFAGQFVSCLHLSLSYHSHVPFVQMRKWGYKNGIHLGLSLYSIGAIFFWPSAVYRTYGGFVACTFVMACGLATLEGEHISTT
jgi:FHS family L-fucose permease-like MFS transporter